jgi:integrase/recombinase XerD
MAQRYPRYGYWFPGNQAGHIRPQQVSMTVGRLFHSIGIEGSIHRCRHVFGTRLLRSGVNIRTVQKLMRHANLDTTANYTAVDEDELRAAIDLLGA